MNISAMLAVIGNLLWLVAYAFIIQKSRQDQVPGVPLAALCANISWELVYSLILGDPLPAQQLMNFAWLSFDAVILMQYLRYGRINSPVSPAVFYTGVGFMLLSSLMLMTTFGIEFGHIGTVYSAFIINLMMSALFIQMFIHRGDLRGQSMTIAVLKAIGTLFPSIHFYTIYPDNVFLNSLYVLIFALDVIYIGLVYSYKRELVWKVPLIQRS